jgi:muramoyltetrapeptide carboxypeptidase
MGYVYKHVRKDTNDVFYVGISLLDDTNYSRAFDRHSRNVMWKGITSKTDYYVHIIEEGLTPEEVKETLRKALFGEAISYTVPSKPYDVKGKASAELVGGNISILYSLLGSKSSIDTNGKILFIEDLDEYLYHIDRMMYNLKRNGYFENVKGIIIGSMADMHDNEIPFGQNEVQIITAIAKEYNIPIAFEFPAGHQTDNRTLILGSQVDFEVNEKEVILLFK